MWPSRRSNHVLAGLISTQPRCPPCCIQLHFATISYLRNLAILDQASPVHAVRTSSAKEPHPRLRALDACNHGRKLLHAPHTPTSSKLITAPTQLGRLFHITFDAVLISAFLAGVKRSTGLTYVSLLRLAWSRQTLPRPPTRPEFAVQDKLGKICTAVSPGSDPPETNLTTSPSLKSESISESPSIKKWVEGYLWVGETVLDQSVAIMGASGYFERKR